MDALIGTFHIDWRLILAQLVNFAVVFAVLYRFALKPLSKILDERKKTIEQSHLDAEKNALLVKEAETIHAEELSKARIEAHALISDIKKTAEEKKAEMMAAAAVDVEKMTADAKKSIEEEKSHMVESLQKEIAGLVLSATEKVVGQNATSHVSPELLNKTISELKKN